jgi:hypothetical protein
MRLNLFPLAQHLVGKTLKFLLSQLSKKKVTICYLKQSLIQSKKIFIKNGVENNEEFNHFSFCCS